MSSPNPLTVARRVLRKLDALAADESVTDPRDLKSIADANVVAMGAIRKIRGLDAPLDWDSLSDEQLGRLAKGQPLR